MKATQTKSPANKVKSEAKVKPQTNSKTQTKTQTKSQTKIQNKTQTSRAQKSTAKRSAADPLSMCPVDGEGWCPYPFSIAQLKKRLKAKAQQT